MNSIDRQLPQDDEVFLDHVGIFARDLNAAGWAAERLGFKISGVNVHSNADAQGVVRISGTSNRLVMLRRGFIEVLAATSDTPLADQLKRAHARYAGLHLIALSHADIPGQRARLTAAGFKMQEIVNLRRTIDMKGAPGGKADVRWSVLRPEPGQMAEGRVQFACPHTPETVWIEGSDAHANAARDLTGVLVCVADRNEAAQRFARYSGKPLGKPAREDAARSSIALDRGRLHFVERAEATRLVPGLIVPSLPFIAGQSISSSDLGKTRAALKRNGVTPLWADDDLVLVGPRDALGACLLFHRETIADPWAELGGRA